MKKDKYINNKIFIFLYMIILVTYTGREVVAEKDDAAKESLLAVNIDIPEKYTEVSPGENLLTIININNRLPNGRIDVILSYNIKDKNNTELISKSETIAIEARSSFSRGFRIPEHIDTGDYKFDVKVQYHENTATASQSFKIIDVTREEKNIVIALLITAMIIFSIILAYEHYRISDILKISEKNLGGTIRR